MSAGPVITTNEQGYLFLCYAPVAVGEVAACGLTSPIARKVRREPLVDRRLNAASSAAIRPLESETRSKL
ncbi:hypothetical protein ABIE33_004729 [Ensifer sp. 4252]